MAPGPGRGLIARLARLAGRAPAPGPEPVLISVTPPRTGERTLLGAENLLTSIAVPEPFSLEVAAGPAGARLMARCLDGEVVRGQVAVRYPQARLGVVDRDRRHPTRVEKKFGRRQRQPLRMDARSQTLSACPAARKTPKPRRKLGSRTR